MALAITLLAWAALAASTATQEPAPPNSQEPAEDRFVFFDDEVEVTELLLALSKAVGLPVEFDAEKVAARVSVRGQTSYTAIELQGLAARELLSRGLTTVHPPGAEGMRVVQIGDAAGLARFEDPSLALTKAAFAKVLVPLQHRSAIELVESIRPLLSKNGTVTAVKEGNALLLADLTAHLDEVLVALRLVDVPARAPAVREFPLEHATPLALAALVERINVTRKQVMGEGTKGSALVVAGSRSLVVVAPPDEMSWWAELVDRFDRPSPARTAEYRPDRFGLRETAKLIDELVAPPPEATETWKVVIDELTGTLLVTADEERHAEVAALLKRLASSFAGPAHPMRAFVIHHRRVSEVVALLQDLLQAGVLEQPLPVAEGEATPAAEEGTAIGGRPPGTPDQETPITITADEPTNRLIAFGDAALLDQLERLIQKLDVRHAQVLIEAIVVTLSDNEAFDLGIEIQKQGVEDGTFYQLASLFGLGSVTPDVGAALPPAGGLGFSGAVLDPGDFSAIVRALEVISRGRTLTRPKVLVNNNQQASLNSVLQTPFASTNASTTVATTSFGGTLDAGTSIQVKPQVADGDQIVLEYTVSISSFIGEPPTAELPPPRQEDKLQSVVTIPDGHTVVVGGLEIESRTEGEAQVPLLGDIPLLGLLFQNRATTNQRTRFFVFLRCEAVKGDAFESLRYASTSALAAAGVQDGWPVLEPRIMR